MYASDEGECKTELVGHPAIIALLFTSGLRQWVFRLGGIGLVLVGLVDNSFIPIPGGLDVFTILLSSGHHELWPYYTFMATVGAVIGAYLTYKIGEEGGKETLERKIGKKRAAKVYQKVERAGFMSVAISVLIPPPFPIVPVLLAAGTLQIPLRRFLSAVAVGRAIRFTIDALLGVFFGHAIIGFFSQYYKPALYTLIGVAVVSGIGALIYYKRWKEEHRPRTSRKEKNAA
ncbi:MAG TPA: VTT domain-containing protein [Terriglobales bacterium]|nr:VTT domain-containing protein [Terriglobales bacterium]